MSEIIREDKQMLKWHKQLMENLEKPA